MLDQTSDRYFKQLKAREYLLRKEIPEREISSILSTKRFVKLFLDMVETQAKNKERITDALIKIDTLEGELRRKAAVIDNSSLSKRSTHRN